MTCRAATTRCSACSTTSTSRPAATRWCCSATWSIAAPPRSRCCAACRARRRGAGACSATTTCTCSAWRTARARPAARTRWPACWTAPDRDALLDWLRQQPMALHQTIGGGDLLMVHAGVLPQWSVGDTLALAAEVEAVLRGPAAGDFLHDDVRQRAGAMERRADRQRAAARHRQRAHAAALLHGRGRDGVRDQGRRRRRARRLHAVVRRAGPEDRGRDRRLRPLVDAGLGVAARPDADRHRLRLGRLPERGAHRRHAGASAS